MAGEFLRLQEFPDERGSSTVYSQQGLQESQLERMGTTQGASYRVVTILQGTEDVVPSGFCSNYISTAKYTVWSFLPRFLFEQFSRYANLFFLLITLIQQVPGVSPTGRWTTIIPLSLVLLATAVKEIVEDYQRHQSDDRLNKTAVRVLNNGVFRTVRWDQVQVGNIVRVVADQSIPADMVLIASSEPNGICYLETANLDGETNLKVRQSTQMCKDLKSIGDLRALEGSLMAEAPNNRLYRFEGNMVRYVDGQRHQAALSADQLALRGAQLRNTQWIWGVVVYTGHDTKLMQSASAAPMKRSKLEKITNTQILLLFFLLILLAMVSTIGSVVWRRKHQDGHWYLGLNFEAAENPVKTFLTFIILYNNLIPISLYITLELVKYVQGIVFINNDLNMYNEETDTPAVVRTSNLNEELGQVQYIFTDKTGTLTRNVMDLRKLSIGGVLYGAMSGEKAPEGVSAEFVNDKGLLVADGFHDPSLLDNLTQQHPTAPVIRQFLTLLAVAHTVIPEVSKDDPQQFVYQAQSPDEWALVTAVKHQGFSFNVRTPEGVTINVLGTDEYYEVLNVLEFTSARKRMSVIVRTPQGTILLMCKGADTAIYERMAANQPFADATLKHLDQFAVQGLRTLCLAVAELDHEKYREWSVRYQEALCAMNDREAKVSKACDEIEQELFLLGATGIEDKLQEKVPETIAALLEAGIKLWMLTGDKQETAINIGYSCKVFSEKMNVLVLESTTRSDTAQWLEKTAASVASVTAKDRKSVALGLVVEGHTLSFCMEDALQGRFLALALQCKSVICCRVSPSQKAQIVELVRKEEKAVTLAIGDGANDVGMIQAANVGVGINGQEGTQAARAADYAIAQFRYLQRLLLVHGQWSYHRLAKLVLYSFYKNIALYFVQFWFAMTNGFSGQILFDEWMLAFYNVLFTLMPPLVIGLFDKTCSDTTLMKVPYVYSIGIRNEEFNNTVFWQWILNAVFHSVLISWSVFMAFSGGASSAGGQIADLWLVGLVVYTAVFTVAVLKASLTYNSWVVWSHVSIWGSVVFYIIFVLIYCAIWPYINWHIASNIYMVDYQMLRMPLFWYTIIVVPIMAISRDYLWKVYTRIMKPSPYHVLQELEMLQRDPTLYRQQDPFEAFFKRVPGISSYVSRGYAFSQEERAHKDGVRLGQADIIRQYDTTQCPPSQEQQ